MVKLCLMLVCLLLYFGTGELVADEYQYTGKAAVRFEIEAAMQGWEKDNFDADALKIALKHAKRGDVDAKWFLIYAASGNAHYWDEFDAEILNTMLKLGVDINTENQQEQTALTYALMSTNEEVAKWLIAHGANINHVNASGQTALHLAAKNGDESLCKKLLALGADVNLQDRDGRTALHMASTEWDGYIGNPGAALPAILEAKGVQLDIQDKRGNTALLGAVWKQYDNVVTQLLKAGANPNIANKAGLTPLVLVRMRKQFSRPDNAYLTKHTQQINTTMEQVLLAFGAALISSDLVNSKKYRRAGAVVVPLYPEPGGRIQADYQPNVRTGVEVWVPKKCPQCITQIILGYHGIPIACVYDGKPGVYPGQFVDHEFVLKGVTLKPNEHYPLQYKQTLEYTCKDGMEKYRQHPPTKGYMGVTLRLR